MKTADGGGGTTFLFLIIVLHAVFCENIIDNCNNVDIIMLCMNNHQEIQLVTFTA